MMRNKKVIAEINPNSYAAEAFRILRTNLQFSTLDHSIKALLITSPGPSEGKSTIVANMGMVMAQTGARVILLDCDLRWGDQHNLFNLPCTTGLSNVLMGCMEISQVMKVTAMPNLKVITCGPLPSNPSELLGSERMKSVLAELGTMADFVLIDSPPTLTVADSAILSSIVDGCLLVIRSAQTKIEDLKQAKERLDQANARIVGTVLNGVDKSEGYFNYGSYYTGKKYKKEVAAVKI